MNFKFSGIIDCNTTFELTDISYYELRGIEKFLAALRKSDCSYVRASAGALVNGKYDRILDVGDRIWFIKRPEEINRISSKCAYGRFRLEKLEKPMEMKIHQVVISKDGITYQVHGFHITQDMIGKYVFLNYEDAVKEMNN